MDHSTFNVTVAQLIVAIISLVVSLVAHCAVTPSPHPSTPEAPQAA
jgi:hypothetical protein